MSRPTLPRARFALKPSAPYSLEQTAGRFGRFVERVDQQWYGYAFVASDYEGVPTETSEAAPNWFAVDAIPYDEMWEDDRLWLPHVLAGRTVRANFLFESSAALAHELRWTAVRQGGLRLR